MSTGTLTIIAETADGAIPIEGASVSVTVSGEKKPLLIAFRETNTSGNTTPVIIETPARELSSKPGDSTPFTVCTVKADHPLYESITVEDVQVFANEMSMQHMNMVPLPENATSEELREQFIITPQNL